MDVLISVGGGRYNNDKFVDSNQGFFSAVPVESGKANFQYSTVGNSFLLRGTEKKTQTLKVVWEKTWGCAHNTVQLLDIGYPVVFFGAILLHVQ